MITQDLLIRELKDSTEMLESLLLRQKKDSATAIAIEKQIMWNLNTISEATK